MTAVLTDARTSTLPTQRRDVHLTLPSLPVGWRWQDPPRAGAGRPSESMQLHAAGAGGVRRIPPALAGRWAAKEAALKVLGADVDRLPVLDIEIGRAPSGNPPLALRGAARELARQQKWLDGSVSMSHEGPFATAVAIATA